MLAGMTNPMLPALPVRHLRAALRSLPLHAAWRAGLSALSRTLDPWLPRACALCESALTQAGTGLCRHCRLSLPGRSRPRCARCGLGLPDSAACPACEQTAFAFDATCVLADYAPPLDRLIGLVGLVATIATPLAPVVLAGTALFVALLAAQGLLGLAQGPVFPMFAAVSQTWFPQRQWALANGGMDSRMDSVRPPDCRPKCVPRSQTRLNSTYRPRRYS